MQLTVSEPNLAVPTPPLPTAAEAPVPAPPKPAPAAQPPVVANLPATPSITVERSGAADTEAPPTPLNLSRPNNWDTLALEPPEISENIAFKKSTRDAVAARREQQATSRALSRATVARLGLPEAEYRRRTDAGEEVKTAKGCFVKRLENGPSGQQERWWRTACRDSKVKPWRREVLSFGPDHKPEISASRTQR